MASKTKEQLANELEQALDRVTELESLKSESERALSDAQRRATRTALVHEIGQRLSGELQLDELLSAVATIVCDAFDYPGVMLLLRDEITERLKLKAIAGACGDIFPQDLQFTVGEGMIGHAATTGESQVSGDVRQDPHYLQGPYEDIRSELAVPIKIRQKVIGVLDLQSDRLNAFDEVDVTTMEALGSQIATAIENAHLFNDASRRTRRLAIINRIAQAASATFRLDDLMKVVYEQIEPVFQPDSFFIALYDKETNETDFCFHIDEGIWQPRVRVPVGGLSNIVISEKKPLIIRDLENEPKYQSLMKLIGTGRPAASWVGAPLLIGERVLGLINVQSYRPHAYTEGDEQLLLTIADQIAVALEKTRLFQEHERQVQEMKAINEVGQVISSVLDLDTVLRQIVDTTKDRFGHYFVSIALVEGERLNFRSGSTIGDLDTRIQPGEIGVSLRQGSSLVAEAVRTEQPVLVNDVLNDPRYFAMEEIPDTRSELSLPIKAKGRVIGVLDVQSDQPFAYDQADVDILSSLTHQAGVAIDNARLFEEALARAEESAVLKNLGQALTARLSVEKVLEEAYRGASRLMDVTTFSIGLYDSEKHEITFPITISESEVDRQIIVMSADQGISGYIIRNRTSVLFKDNVREQQEAMGIAMVGEEPQSWLGVPLMIGARAVGVMSLQSFTASFAYNEHDLELLTSIASATAIALQNAHLFEKSENALAEAEKLALEQIVLNELGQALTTRLTVDEAQEEAYRQASRLIDTTNFFIGLYDPNEHEITFSFNISDSEIDREIAVISADDGLAGYIVRNRTGLLFEENVTEGVHALGIDIVGANAQSWLGVPMIVGDKVLGVIAVQSHTIPCLYGKHEQDLLSAVANQLGIALQNVRLFEQAQRRVREMQMLHSVAIAAASGGVRFEATLQSTAEALGAEYEEVHIGIALLDQTTSRLHRLANSGSLPTGEFPKEGIPVGKGVIGWVVRNAEPALIPDVHVDSRYIGVLAETRSELCVPLIANGEVIGIINIESHRVNVFTEDDMRLLLVLADSLAVLVERAQLFDNMEQMVEERTTELRDSLQERERLQEEIIEAQQLALQELSTPVIPIIKVPEMGTIIAMPLIGSIDTMRARDITRALLAGIRKHQAKAVILDITGVPIVDSGVASHLNKTIQAARLKGARTIITGISEDVAETIVDLGIDWGGIETLPDLQTGLLVALRGLGLRLARRVSKR
ncbi:MAG: GAF domain-containing protein [Chloroflexi bacterium]|nr:GAF domain-containing protein [Chloroflexota bacterium]